MYKDAISKIPLTEKVETIKEKENYTKIEEVPEIYIKAVISVEDHRFYKKRNGTHDRHGSRCGIGILGAPGPAVRGLH